MLSLKIIFLQNCSLYEQAKWPTMRIIINAIDDTFCTCKELNKIICL